MQPRARVFLSLYPDPFVCEVLRRQLTREAHDLNASKPVGLGFRAGFTSK